MMFSRTFYKANNLEEFPNHMRDCLQRDYRGRFYEDFYRFVFTLNMIVYVGLLVIILAVI